MAEPTKAYYVERISRTVSIVLVHADSAKDAKQRAANGEGTGESSESSPRGYGRIWREPSEDRREPTETGEER